MEYKIQDGQTALDVVNQLYTTTDSLNKLMLENVDFDINTMNTNETVIFDELNNQIRNEIVNNEYTFINRDNIVYYQSHIQENAPAGKYEIPEFINTYIYIVEQNEYKWLTASDYSFIVLVPSDIIIYSEGI